MALCAPSDEELPLATHSIKLINTDYQIFCVIFMISVTKDSENNSL